MHGVIMRAIAYIGWFGVTATLVAANIAFMTGLARDAEPIAVLAYSVPAVWPLTLFALAIDSIMIAAPFKMAEAAALDQRWRKRVGMLVWVIAIGFSMHSSHGFVEGFLSSRQAPVQQSETRRDEIAKDLESERGKLAQVRRRMESVKANTDQYAALSRDETTSMDRIKKFQAELWGAQITAKPAVVDGFSWIFAALLCALNALTPFALFGDGAGITPRRAGGRDGEPQPIVIMAPPPSPPLPQIASTRDVSPKQPRSRKKPEAIAAPSPGVSSPPGVGSDHTPVYGAPMYGRAVKGGLGVIDGDAPSPRPIAEAVDVWLAATLHRDPTSELRACDAWHSFIHTPHGAPYIRHGGDARDEPASQAFFKALKGALASHARRRTKDGWVYAGAGLVADPTPAEAAAE